MGCSFEKRSGAAASFDRIHKRSMTNVHVHYTRRRNKSAWNDGEVRNSYGVRSRRREKLLEFLACISFNLLSLFDVWKLGCEISIERATCYRQPSGKSAKIRIWPASNLIVAIRRSGNPYFARLSEFIGDAEITASFIRK